MLSRVQASSLYGIAKTRLYPVVQPYADPALNAGGRPRRRLAPPCAVGLQGLCSVLSTVRPLVGCVPTPSCLAGPSPAAVVASPYYQKALEQLRPVHVA